MPHHRLSRLALLATGLVALANSAAAASPPSLATPDITQVLNIRGDQQVSHAKGYQSLGSGDSKGSTSGSSSVALGSSPSVSTDMAEQTYVASAAAGLHGGSTYSQLIYQFAYFNPNGGYGNVAVHVNAFDNVHASASGISASATAESFLEISGGGFSTYLNHCAGADTAGGTPCGNKGTAAILPFDLTLKQNTAYTVRLRVDAQSIANYELAGLSQASAWAELAIPGLSVIGTSPSGGRFVFSGGITPVSEPASWALMMGGMGLVAGAARRRRKAAPVAGGLE